MKILIITDLHTLSIDEFYLISDLPKSSYDVCFTLGDIDYVYLKELKKRIKSPIYGVNGNHDSWTTVQDAGIENISEKLLTFKDVDGKVLRITALQGSRKYRFSNSYCMYSQRKSIKLAKKLQKADIFITHDIPFSIFNRGIHKGLKGVKWYIKNKKPVLHIHGHMHQNTCEQVNKTTSIGIFRCSIIDTETLEVNRIF